MLLGPPEVNDGAALWALARDADLDLNSSYSYLLWCRDFAATSVVARVGGDVAGFVTGYLRPEAGDSFVVWQVAVAASHRNIGLARRMLHHLTDRLLPAGARFLEATITPGNEPSLRLFSGFARDRGAHLDRRVLFDAGLFPDGHDPEILLRIGPIAPPVPQAAATAAP
ncbi:MAG: diaminobutyrate acetyltransferase [Carbonactinosporaceae bacterium]